MPTHGFIQQGPWWGVPNREKLHGHWDWAFEFGSEMHCVPPVSSVRPLGTRAILLLGTAGFIVLVHIHIKDGCFMLATQSPMSCIICFALSEGRSGFLFCGIVVSVFAFRKQL